MTKATRRTTLGLALGIILSAIGLVWLSQGRPNSVWKNVATLDELHSEGVVYDVELNIFILELPEDPLALAGWSPHTPGRSEHVLFCRSSQTFVSPAHGETFDRQGVYAGGPAPRGLDRVDLQINNGHVLVNPQEISPGPARRINRPEDPQGPLCADDNPDDEPGFLEDP